MLLIAASSTSCGREPVDCTCLEETYVAQPTDISADQPPTPDTTTSAPDRELLDILGTRLAEIRQQIADAKQKAEEFSAGAVGHVAKARLEILLNDEALIQLRIDAEQTGAKYDYTVAAGNPDPGMAASLERDLILAQEQVTTARTELESLGGMARGMKQMDVLMLETTVTLLEQGILIAKYGLRYPAVAPGSLTLPPGRVERAIP